MPVQWQEPLAVESPEVTTDIVSIPQPSLGILSVTGLAAAATESDYNARVEEICNAFEMILGHTVARDPLPFRVSRQTEVRFSGSVLGRSDLDTLMATKTFCVQSGNQVYFKHDASVEHEAIETTDLCTAIIGGKEDVIRGWLKNKQIADVNMRLKGYYPVHHAGAWTRKKRARSTSSSVSVVRNRASLCMVQQLLRV